MPVTIIVGLNAAGLEFCAFYIAFDEVFDTYLAQMRNIPSSYLPEEAKDALLKLGQNIRRAGSCVLSRSGNAPIAP